MNLAVKGYKINMQKSFAFLYANNKQQKKKSRNLSLLQLHEKTRYLGINLTKGVKDIYSEKDRTLMKEIEEDTKKWKSISCSWIGR